MEVIKKKETFVVTLYKKDKSDKTGSKKIPYTEVHRKWTKESANEYIRRFKEGDKKGLTYWSASDFLAHHAK